MLPHINTKDGHLASNNGILVLCGHDAQTLTIFHQPSPSAPLQAEQGLTKRRLEAVERAPDLGDLSDERGRALRLGFGRACGGQVLPEERVVDVSAAVELDGGLKGDLTGDVGSGGVRLEGVVEVGDVGLVVLGVMELHDLGGDAGLEGLERESQYGRISGMTSSLIRTL